MISKRTVTAAMEMYMCRMCMCFVMPYSEKVLRCSLEG